MSECTHRRPAGAGAGGGGGVAEGHEERQDDHKTTKGTEQRGRRNGKRKQTNPSPEGSRKDMWLVFTKGKFSYVYFNLPYKDLSKLVRSPLHHMTALVYSSHPIHCYVPPEKPSLNTRTQLCLRK